MTATTLVAPPRQKPLLLKNTRDIPDERVLRHPDTGATARLIVTYVTRRQRLMITVPELLRAAKRTYQAKRQPAYFTLAFADFRWQDVEASILHGVCWLAEAHWLHCSFPCGSNVIEDIKRSAENQITVRGTLPITLQAIPVPKH